MINYWKYVLKNRIKRDIITLGWDILIKNRHSAKKFLYGTIHRRYKRMYPFQEKAGKIMCKAAEVGKIVVNKCLDQSIPINTQKLQKLLVLMQVECIRRAKKPLFKEDIRIWNCGVAIKEVDDEFSIYAEGFFEKQEEFITLLEAEESSVDYILRKYANSDVFELNQLPDNEKVQNLGVVCGHTETPHVSYQILMGAFANDTDVFCD